MSRKFLIIGSLLAGIAVAGAVAMVLAYQKANRAKHQSDLSRAQIEKIVKQLNPSPAQRKRGFDEAIKELTPEQARRILRKAVRGSSGSGGRSGASLPTQQKPATGGPVARTTPPRSPRQPASGKPPSTTSPSSPTPPSTTTPAPPPPQRCVQLLSIQCDGPLVPLPLLSILRLSTTKGR